MSHRHQLVAIFTLALLIRLALVGHPGFKADIAFWKWWGKEAAEQGVVKAIQRTNYPPLYMYVLKITSQIYAQITHIDDSYWNDHNYLYLLLIKLPYIAADLGIGYLIYSIITDLQPSAPTRSSPLQKASQKNPKSGPWNLIIGTWNLGNVSLLATTLFLFNPAVIYNGAVWGQTDSLSSFAILLMYYSLLKNRLLTFASLAAVNIFFKVQSLPFVALSSLIILRKSGISKFFSTFIPTIITAAAINLPFLLRSSLGIPVNIMLNSLGYFPYASLNAYNLHWLLIAGSSDRYPDTNLILNLVSHKSLGTLLFATCALLIFRSFYKSLENTATPNPDETRSLFFHSLLLIFSSFMLMTEIHERYLFPVYVFGALLLTTRKTARHPTTVMAPHIYLLFALSGLINLHLVMIQNYPDNNLSFLQFLTTTRIPASIVISLVNLALFLYLLLPLVKSLEPKLRASLALLPLALLLPRFRPIPNPTPLTSLTPTSVTQQWGQLTIDKSVGGNLLAPAYYFHRRGLGTHANSQITYNLANRYSRFTTGYGTDIESSDTGSVIFAILVDDKPVFQSDIMRKWTPPGFIDIKLAHADKLTLLTLDAGDGINGDHADWLEPRLYR